MLTHTHHTQAEGAYTLVDMAEDAVSLLKYLNIQQAHVMGASMGGMIAQIVALRHPEMTLTLTSIFSTPGGDPSLPEALTRWMNS